MLDEGLAAITLLWSGEPVSFHGMCVTVEDVIMRPTPVQRPRVPIWIGGGWPGSGPARRAARWDGSVLKAGNEWGQPPDAEVVAEMHAFFQARRSESGRENEPFDLVVGGSTGGNPAKAQDILGPLGDAGATWWDECFPISQLDKFEVVRARIEEGPPRIDA
jgi:alkanesulfonate monooxygenase SsuD/methylene tetrahydromethanopterin reductase-like flavin-dependent oxidoreductase (luciferase family)